MTLKCFEFECVDSTQDRAFQLLEENPRDPILVSTQFQTRGRGRLSRDWISESGRSLIFTLGLSLRPQNFEGLSLVVGLSLRRTINRSDLKIKWPNDLMIEDSKVGGILIESKTLGVETHLCIGVGVNLFDLEAAQFKGLGFVLSAREMAEAILVDLDQFFTTGFSSFYEDFNRWMWRKNQVATYSVDGASVSGRLLGVDQRGWLRFEEGKTIRLTDQGELLVESP